MSRQGSENVSDRRRVVEGRADRDPYAGRAFRRAGEALEVDLDLQSDNFVSGSSGWRLERETGDFEANDGTFRGSLAGADGTFAGDLAAAGGTFQGVVTAGGGAVVLDNDGIRIEEGSNLPNNLDFGVPGGIRASINKAVNSWLGIDSLDGISLSTPGRWEVGTGDRVDINAGGQMNVWAFNDITFDTSAGQIVTAGGLLAQGGIQANQQIRRGPQTSVLNNTSGEGCLLNLNHIQVARSGGVAAHFNRMSSNGTLVSLRRSGSQVGSIGVTTTAASFNTSSDYRLKENFEAMSGALERVGMLRPGTFDWKVGGAGEGFLAHELAEVVPDAVTGEKDGDEFQAVDHSKLVPLLVAAVQELTGQVEELRALLGE